MINFPNNGQEIDYGQTLDQDQFNRLRLQTKHAYLDCKMGDRIKLSYNLAINECRSLIDSDVKLSNAFKNFQDYKNYNPRNYHFNEDILVGAFVDKISERIYLVIKRGLDEIFHYHYDIPSKQLINYATETITELEIEYEQNIPSNIKYIRFYSDSNDTFENIWRTATLFHNIYNRNVVNNYGNALRNQEYVSDNHYRLLNKYFCSLDTQDELNTWGGLNSFNSLYNPAHTILDPEDLLNPPKITSIKSARNI